MKLPAIALLLFATAANAQWVSPVEQSYGPYLAPSIGAEPAIVASNHGVLLAWSELDPITKISAIRTGVLDFNGRLVSPITKLPTYLAAADALGPVVATDGETFAVAWQESSTRGAAIALDANGATTAQPLLFGRADVRLRGTPPLIWNGEAYQIHGLAFDHNSVPVFPETNLPASLRYAAGGAFVGMTWVSNPRTYRCGWGIGHGCNWFDAEFIITWEIVRGKQHAQRSKQMDYYATDPIVAGDDDELAIVWRAPDTFTGIRVDGEFNNSSFTFLKFTLRESLDITRPEGIAFDGERWLVVFTRNDDIWGAFIDRNRTSHDFESFPIATGGRKESNARVTTLAPGRFLVSYSSDIGADDHRFAGRVVLAESPKKTRAIR